jgi:3-hydroxyacyl-[acyl-carrier-protein] dehydratase
MPSTPILDPALVDPDRRVFTQAEIYRALPQQFEFRQLDGICYYDPVAKVAAAVRNVGLDEWWVRGHIPGRPIFPGVLMLEAVAQLSAYVCKYMHGYSGMVAFGGVDRCKFRTAIVPPARVILVCREAENRPKRIICETQAFLDGVLAFEATIVGLALPD